MSRTHLARKRGNTLSAAGEGLDRLIALGLALALACLVLGVTLPVMTVRQLWVFPDTFSIADAGWNLLTGDEVLLGLVVVLFSMVFPGVKITAAFVLWRMIDLSHPRHGSALALVEGLGKWSLADVLVVALVIVVAKSSWFAEARAEVGLYFFTASVTLSVLAVYRIGKVAERVAT